MMIEKLKISAELNKEEYNQVEKVVEALKAKFPDVLVRKYRTQKKMSFIDVELTERVNFDIILGKRKNYFISVEMEGNKSKYAIQIMKFLLDEAGISYSLSLDGKEVYTALKEKLKENSLLEHR